MSAGGVHARSTVTVSLPALVRNYTALTHYIAQKGGGVCCEMTAGRPPARPICVVKANAYGHGLRPCVRALCHAGADYFAVSSAAEALEARRACPRGDILVLGAVDARDVPLLCRQGISVPAGSRAELYALLEACRAAKDAHFLSPGAGPAVHIVLDTGMGRYGFPCRDLREARATVDVVASLASVPGWRPVGLFSHFAMADETDAFARHETARARAAFATVRAGLRARGLPLFAHCANSAAALRWGAAGLDGYRLGIALYGLPPSASCPFPPALAGVLRAPLSWQGRVLGVSDVRRGMHVGYGGAYRAPGARRIATVGVGYADGLLRACAGGHLLWRGHRLPLVGRICMDACMVEVGDLPLAAGDLVTLYEGSGRRIAVLAQQAGTIPYELLTAISHRPARRYLPLLPGGEPESPVSS